MKVLIVINDLNGGGAQRSLVSFLTCLAENDCLSKYDIDLLVSSKSGLFEDRIPKAINLLKTNKRLVWMNCPLKSKALIKSFSFSCIALKIKWIVTLRYNKKVGSFSTGKTLWNSWKKYIPNNKEKYDVAISYMDGWPNYYVMEKVEAKKKILWIHNEYQKLGYDPAYDLQFYNECDKIVTISERCKLSFLEVFPQFAYKIHVLENISLTDEIIRRSKEFEPKEFNEYRNQWKIISIGRLSYQKGFDLSIGAAKKLQRRQVPFVWFIVGDGPDKESLLSLIKTYKLEKNVFMLGVKSNPYPYIKEADVFVQTSRFEGKSIVLDEAKILKKPIVVTRYDTVYDSIADGQTGVVVEMDEESIANGIYNVLVNPKLRTDLRTQLQICNYNNKRELEKYIDVML